MEKELTIKIDAGPWQEGIPVAVPPTPTCLPTLLPTAGDEPHDGAYNVMTAAPGGRTIERRTRWQKYIFLRPITEWIKINVSKTDVTKISTPGP